MNKAFFLSLQASLLAIASWCVMSDVAQAQITPDNSGINTQTNQNGNVTEITGGQTRGNNLFHSFQDFSVGTGNEAFFNNANSISNIFSRVTGGNISNIDGLIRNNGSASLFLINPAGIIFGENARLDIGGSFYSSSASSILFEDGEFSASDLENPPLLTVNAPIGLGFRDNPGDIVNRSTVENADEEVIGLEVGSGNNLGFIGGNVIFEDGNATARGGNISLGGLSEAGTVNIDSNGNLTFPEAAALANISLLETANIDAIGTGGGNITLIAQNLEIAKAEGERNDFLAAGISEDSISPDAQGGDISILVREDVVIDNASNDNKVAEGGVGNSGDINVEAGNLSLINGSDIFTGTDGTGNGGDINVTVRDTVTIDGQNSEGDISSLSNQVGVEAQGNAGGINITAGNLNFTNGGSIFGIVDGVGDTGNININATDTVNFDGETTINFTLAGGITNLVRSGEGKAGDVSVTANNVSFTNGARIDASTLGRGNAGSIEIIATDTVTFDGETSQGNVSGVASEVREGAEGNAGDISITTGNLILTNGANIFASTQSIGDAGNVTINATENITFDGENSIGFVFGSGISNTVRSGAEGNAGNISIAAGNIDLTNGGRIDSSTEGIGNGGSIDLNISDTVTIDGEISGGFVSSVASEVRSTAQGNAGNISINTSDIIFTNGGSVFLGTFGRGDAGSVNINASNTISFDGENTGNNSDVGNFGSGIVNFVSQEAQGNAGNISLTANNISFTNGARIDSSTEGMGDAGDIELTATDTIAFDGQILAGFVSSAASEVREGAEGNAGDIVLSANKINFTNGGSVFAITRGIGDAGNVNLTVTDTVSFDGESLANADGMTIPTGVVSVVAPEAQGNAGIISITANNIDFTNGGRIDASTEGIGDAGNVNLIANDTISFDGQSAVGGVISSAISEVRGDAEGNAGDISIDTGNLIFTNGGSVFATTEGIGNGGNVNIIARDTVTFDGESRDVVPTGIVSVVDDEAQGNAGNINITTTNLNFSNGGRIDASTEGIGNAGLIDLVVRDTITFDGENSEGFTSSAISAVRRQGEGNAGGIEILTSNLVLTNGGRIDASTEGIGNAGSVEINATESIFISDNTAITRSGISANALVNDGNGGNVNIVTDRLTIENGGTIEASNFDNVGNLQAGTGEPGNINIEANSVALSDSARIEAATQSETGESGIIKLQVAENITLRDNSFLSAQAFEDANGGNLEIDARFIIAFPSSGTGNDLIATADRGTGGNIDLNAEAIFGLQIGDAIDNETDNAIDNNSNDIDASSGIGGLDGTITINAPDINPVEGTISIPQNVVSPEQTTAQACQADRATFTPNKLTIAGKGGISAEPGSPLSSSNLLINGIGDPNAIAPQPIKISSGEIQPARGIKITESGEIILTAYRTNNSGDRLPAKRNCAGV